MRIFIITMEDPVYTLPFIREIIDQRKQDIVGLAVAHGDRMTIGKNRSQIVYLFSLLLICLLYTSPSPRDRTRSRMPSSA